MKNLHLALSETAGRNILKAIRETSSKGQVFYLKDDLSFGPLPVDVDNFYPRYQWLQDFFGEYSLAAQQVHYYHNFEILTEVENRLKHLDTRLIIWAGSTANDLSWIRYLSKFFQEWDLIEWVCMDDKKLEENVPACFDDLEADQINSYITCATRPSTTKIQQLQEEYDSLVHDRSLLRTIQNGELVSANLNFYDDLVMKEFTMKPKDGGSPNGEEKTPIAKEFMESRWQILSDMNKDTISEKPAKA
jgi:hypothetical protein